MLLDLVSVANRKRWGFNSSSRKYSGGSFLKVKPLLLLDMLNLLSCSSHPPCGGNGSAVAAHPVFIPGGGIDSDEADGSGFPAGWPVGILLLDTLGGWWAWDLPSYSEKPVLRSTPTPLYSSLPSCVNWCRSLVVLLEESMSMSSSEKSSRSSGSSR